MARCVVTCPECAKDGRPRRWRENCEACANRTADAHRRETGHSVEIDVVVDHWLTDRADPRVVDALARKCGCGAAPGVDCEFNGKPLPGRIVHHYRIDPKLQTGEQK